MNQSISEEFEKRFCWGNVRGDLDYISQKNVEQIKSFLQSKISEAIEARDRELREKVEGMAFEQPAQAGQFAMHTDGYNQAIEEVLDLIKEQITPRRKIV